MGVAGIGVGGQRVESAASGRVPILVTVVVCGPPACQSSWLPIFVAVLRFAPRLANPRDCRHLWVLGLPILVRESAAQIQADVVAELLANVRKASSAFRSSGPNFPSGDMQATWDPQGILSGSGRDRRGWPEGGVGGKWQGANPRDRRRLWAPCLPILVAANLRGCPQVCPPACQSS